MIAMQIGWKFTRLRRVKKNTISIIMVKSHELIAKIQK